MCCSILRTARWFPKGTNRDTTPPPSSRRDLNDTLSLACHSLLLQHAWQPCGASPQGALSSLDYFTSTCYSSSTCHYLCCNMLMSCYCYSTSHYLCCNTLTTHPPHATHLYYSTTMLWWCNTPPPWGCYGMLWQHHAMIPLATAMVEEH